MFNEKEYQREYQKKYYLLHKGKKKFYDKQKRKNWLIKNREKTRKYKQEERLEHPDRVKARQLARRKIKIPKGQLCQKCNKQLAIEKHHEDYKKPLEVKFYCFECHHKGEYSNV